MSAPRYTFHKEERLTNHRLIGQVMDRRQNRSAFQYPLLMAWVPAEVPGPFPAQVLVSVPKRKFPHASDRNLLKRRIREAYRHQKHHLYDFLSQHHLQAALMLMYISKDVVSYNSVEHALKKLIRKFEDAQKNPQPAPPRTD